MKRIVKFVIAAVIIGCAGSVAAGAALDLLLEKLNIRLESTERAGEELTAEQEPPDDIPAEASDADYPGITAAHGYCYQLLLPEAREVYDSIYQAVTGLDEMADLGRCSADAAANIYACVLHDHPECFWLSDEYTVWAGGEDHESRMILEYNLEKRKIPSVKEKLEERTGQISDKINPNWSSYDKIKYVYEYIIKNTEYTEDGEQHQNIQGVFLNGAASDAGYAKAFQYLMRDAGIFCMTVEGTEAEKSHWWNLVYLDEDFYWVDTASGDTLYSEDGSKAEIDYGYLCCTSEELMKNRVANPPEKDFLPECKGVKYNYFLINNAFFAGFNKISIVDSAEEQFGKGNYRLDMKFADEKGYELAAKAMAGGFADTLSGCYKDATGTEPEQMILYPVPDELRILVEWK